MEVPRVGTKMTEMPRVGMQLTRGQTQKPKLSLDGVLPGWRAGQGM